MFVTFMLYKEPIYTCLTSKPKQIRTIMKVDSKISQFFYLKKSCLRETLTLSTDADISTDSTAKEVVALGGGGKGRWRGGGGG